MTDNSKIEGTNSSRNRNRSGLWRKILLYSGVAAFLGAIVYGFIPKPVVVETGLVTRGPLTISIIEEGETRIRHRYVISSPVSGYLSRVELRPGAEISAGETFLATIDAQPSGLLDPRTKAEAEARFEAASAMKQLRETEVERARAAHELAKKELERIDALGENEIVSIQERDSFETRALLSELELQGAEFALSAATFEAMQARAVLEQFSNLVANGDYAVKILSPIDGVVLKVFEENARIVPAGASIMEVGDPRALEAEIELLSSDAQTIPEGAEVTFERLGEGARIRGRVKIVEPVGFTKLSALGVEEQRVIVRVDFIDPIPENVKLGDRYRVEAQIVTWHSDDVLLVPASALFRKGRDWMTFVAVDGKALLRKVGIAHNDGISAEVTFGLSRGESVILYPPDSLRDESKVTIEGIKN
ncbi:MAG: HlyD family efflux transporter periplasmic adaptor subunit [Planctomycetes bacterium]|nr:HlyD family efflux transporter periplasmic adaptor subunit [Planctomycetota bacterium]